MILRKKFTLLLLLISLFVLPACQNSSVEITPTIPGEEVVVTETSVPTEIPVPTDTPAPNTIILAAPAEGSSDEALDMQTWLSAWAGENGYLLEVKPQIDSASVIAGCKVVVILDESGSDVNSLAQQHPETTFVVLRTTSMENQPANVVTLAADPNNLYFAAGFISILIAQDWRLGALLPWEDGVSGAETQEAFTNGAAYHCGRCASTYMPVALFPVISSLSSTSAPETWMAEILTLDNQYYLNTVFVAKEAASEQLYQQLVTQNVIVVGSQKPDGIEGLLWGASINQDASAALSANWDAIINGTLSENEIIVPVVLTEINEDYLSPGRKQMFDQMMQTLLDGWVSPLSPDYP